VSPFAVYTESRCGGFQWVLVSMRSVVGEHGHEHEERREAKREKPGDAA
jgi:hypothetical protein